MLREIVTSPQASDEAGQAYDWYQKQEPGLGDRFIAALDRAVQSLVIQPQIYSRRFNEVRGIKIKKFPYTIYYEYDDWFIYLQSVFHESKNPRHLDRLRD